MSFPLFQSDPILNHLVSKSERKKEVYPDTRKEVVEEVQ